MVKSKKIEKTMILFLAVALMIVTLAGNVYAYQKLCLTKGQVVPNEQNQRYICKGIMYINNQGEYVTNRNTAESILERSDYKMLGEK